MTEKKGNTREIPSTSCMVKLFAKTILLCNRHLMQTCEIAGANERSVENGKNCRRFDGGVWPKSAQVPAAMRQTAKEWRPGAKLQDSGAHPKVRMLNR